MRSVSDEDVRSEAEGYNLDTVNEEDLPLPPGETIDSTHEEADNFFDAPVWFSISDVTKDILLQLDKKFRLHPLTVEDILSTGFTMRDKFEEFDDWERTIACLHCGGEYCELME